MAKRTPPRSQADDGTAAPPRPRATGRERAAGASPTTGASPAAGALNTEAATGQDQTAAISDTFVGEPDTAGEPVQSGAPKVDRGATSMQSEPTEDDIRLRAYQRYLERGGGHGLDYDDWLEAERELKGNR